MRALVMAIRAVVRVVVMAGSILVMPERHALARRNSRQALDRNGQSQQQYSNKPEEGFRHLGAAL
jgi:hypothetical protein